MTFVVVMWLLLSICAGMVARNKGRSFFGFFLLSLLLSPLIGIIFALVMSKNQKKLDETALQHGHKKCPKCAEIIKAEAVVCKHCGNEEFPEPVPVKINTCPRCGGVLPGKGSVCVICKGGGI